MAAEFVTPTADNPVLQEIVRRLVDTYHPEKIYLFGSAARGETTPDSDYDLMVIVPNEATKRPRFRAGLRSALGHHGSRRHPGLASNVLRRTVVS